MGLKLYFNPKALEALAKELRRASWGVGAAAAVGGVKLENASVLVAGGLGWLVLQVAAVALESIREERSVK
ncbi:hypothetical protein [Sulfuricystis multivorans]|uniref:hypothetical protein n=1 Tax=Sulfuricystis multivorans TaxID=2211108 RepID=UPI000F81C0F7|nr:hypothetical protein [Sulfuricystis multivorans]